MAPASVSTVHLHIRGVVQGVGFRPHVYSIAKRLDLAGWVRNSSDGVYCLVQGPCEAIDRFVAAVRAEAPPMAVIDEIVAEEVGQTFGPDTLAEARNRGYRPASPGARRIKRKPRA